MPAAKIKGSNKDYHRLLGREFDSEREAYESLFPSKCKLKNRKTGDLCSKEHGECLNKKACGCTKSFQFYFCPFTNKWSLWDDGMEYHSTDCHLKSNSNDNLQNTYEKNILQKPPLPVISDIDGHLPQVKDAWFRSRDIYLILRMYIMTQFSGISWESVTIQVKKWVDTEKKRIAKEKLVPSVKINLHKIVTDDSDESSDEDQNLDFDELLRGVQVELNDTELFDLLCLLDDNLVTTEKRKASYEIVEGQHNKSRRIQTNTSSVIASNIPAKPVPNVYKKIMTTADGALPSTESDSIHARTGRRSYANNAITAGSFPPPPPPPPAAAAAPSSCAVSESVTQQQKRFPAVSFMVHPQSLTSNLTSASVAKRAEREKPYQESVQEGVFDGEIEAPKTAEESFSLMADAVIANALKGAEERTLMRVCNAMDIPAVDEYNESVESLQSGLESINLSVTKSKEDELLKLKENRIEIINKIKSVLKKQTSS